MSHIRFGSVNVGLSTLGLVTVVLVVVLVAVLLAAPPGAAAQSGGEPSLDAPSPGDGAVAPEPSVEQLHDELRALRAAMEKALNEGDVDGLVEHVTPDVVFTTMNGDVVRGADAVREYYTRMMKGEDRVVDSVTAHFEPDALSILYGRHMAVAFGSTDDHYELAGGRTFDIAARWTATLVRRAGAWKIAAFHYSTNMFDNPILQAQRSFLIKVAIAAVLLAFVVALLIGRALGRRASGT